MTSCDAGDVVSSLFTSRAHGRVSSIPEKIGLPQNDNFVHYRDSVGTRDCCRAQKMNGKAPQVILTMDINTTNTKKLCDYWHSFGSSRAG